MAEIEKEAEENSERRRRRWRREEERKRGLIDRQTYRQTHRQADGQTHTHTQTDRLSDRHFFLFVFTLYTMNKSEEKKDTMARVGKVHRGS